MKVLSWNFPRLLLDSRVIVGLVGALLSVVMHELFHVIVHLGEVTGVSILPGTGAIVAVTLAYTAEYHQGLEEALAYVVTLVVLLLTTMLVCDIHDSRSTKSIRQTILPKDFSDTYSQHDEYMALNHLSELVGVDRSIR